MSPLLEAGLIEVNARGHYRVIPTAQPASAPQAPVKPCARASNKSQAKVVGDDYFPTHNGPVIVDGDYFPSE